MSSKTKRQDADGPPPDAVVVARFDVKDLRQQCDGRTVEETAQEEDDLRELPPAQPVAQAEGRSVRADQGSKDGGDFECRRHLLPVVSDEQKHPETHQHRSHGQ